jgi:hypothetical protein
MNKRITGLALLMIAFLLQHGYSQLPLQPKHTLKVFPGIFWNMLGYEFCPTAHVGIHVSTGGTMIDGYPQGVTVLDLRWYPMKEGGKRFGDSNRGILPYIGLWGGTARSQGEENSSRIFLGPGLLAGTRIRLGKRPSLDCNVGGVPNFLVFDPEDDWQGPAVWPRVSLTFGWTLGLRNMK